jgi:hypothetical protein
LIGSALLAALAFATPAGAAEPPPPISGVFDIGGKMVPLPDGEWRLVAEEMTPG